MESNIRNQTMVVANGNAVADLPRGMNVNGSSVSAPSAAAPAPSDFRSSIAAAVGCCNCSANEKNFWLIVRIGVGLKRCARVSARCHVSYSLRAHREVLVMSGGDCRSADAPAIAFADDIGEIIVDFAG